MDYLWKVVYTTYDGIKKNNKEQKVMKKEKQKWDEDVEIKHEIIL